MELYSAQCGNLGNSLQKGSSSLDYQESVQMIKFLQN